MPITPQEALQRAIEHREIFFDEMVDLMRQIKSTLDPLHLLNPGKIFD